MFLSGPCRQALTSMQHGQNVLVCLGDNFIPEVFTTMILLHCEDPALSSQQCASFSAKHCPLQDRAGADLCGNNKYTWNDVHKRIQCFLVMPPTRRLTLHTRSSEDILNCSFVSFMLGIIHCAEMLPSRVRLKTLWAKEPQVIYGYESLRSFMSETELWLFLPHLSSQQNYGCVFTSGGPPTQLGGLLSWMWPQ